MKSQSKITVCSPFIYKSAQVLYTYKLTSFAVKCNRLRYKRKGYQSFVGKSSFREQAWSTADEG